jgi:hypothetical protein
MVEMKLAYIWHSEVERSALAKLIQREKPSWQIISLHYTDVSSLDKVLMLAKSDLDAIMLHLSLPHAVALKLAELYHREHLRARIILSSRTDADPESIRRLFSGHVHPDKDIGRITTKIQATLERPPEYLPGREVEEAIVAIFNSDDVLPSQFRQRFGVLYRGAFTFDDYNRFSQAFLIEDSMDAVRSSAAPVFISYSSKDQALAQELQQAFSKRGVSSFVAARDLAGGSPWESDIRDAILGCREMLILITPNSRSMPWIMIEAGAGWALGKRMTPCIAYSDVGELPEPISKSQSRSVITTAQRDLLVREVCARLGPAAGTHSDESAPGKISGAKSKRVPKPRLDGESGN